MSVARHTAYNFFGAAVPLVVSLATVPLYLNLIGFDRYGLLAICWTILGFLGFLNLGMGPAVVQRLATATASSPAQRSEIVWAALAISLLMGAIGSLLIISASQLYFDQISDVGAGLRQEIGSTIPWLAAGLPIAMLTGVLTGTLQGLQRFGTINIITGVNAILAASLPLAAAFLISPTLEVLVGTTVIVNGAIFVALFAISAGMVPLGSPTPPSFATVRDLASYGGWMSANTLLAPAITAFDRFLIGALKGPVAVTAFVIPYNLVSRILLFPASLSTAALPRLAGSGDREVHRLQDLSIKSLLAVLTPISVIAIAIVGPFLDVWIGSDLPPVASQVAIILIGGFWLHGLGYLSSTVVMARGRPDLLTKLLLSYLAPYVLVLYLLTDSLGVLGAALAWAAKSACEPLIFFLTKPNPSSVRKIIMNLAIVASAVGAGMGLATDLLVYTTVMAGLIVISCAVNWSILSQWLAHASGAIFNRMEQ